MKNFTPKAAFHFANLVANYVGSDDSREFCADFEKFMDAYENGNTKKRAEPVAGEIYRDVFGHKIRVLATRSTPACSSEMTVEFFVSGSDSPKKIYKLRVENFMNANFRKED